MFGAGDFKGPVNHYSRQRSQQLAVHPLAPNAIHWLHGPFQDFKRAATCQTPAATTNHANPRQGFYCRRIAYGLLPRQFQAASLYGIDFLSCTLHVFKCVFVTEDEHPEEACFVSFHVQKRLQVGCFGGWGKHQADCVYSACTSPSHHRHHGKARGPKLECGHSLSTSQVRTHIKEALQAKEGVIPSCCGLPLPRATLEVVLTKEETDRVLEGAVQSPELSSLRDSGYSENGMSSIDLPRPAQAPLPITSKSVPNTPPRRVSLQLPNGNSSLANEALKSFKSQQKEQLERVAAFESNQRKALSAHHQLSLKRLAAQHENNKDERKEQVSEVAPGNVTQYAYATQHVLELEDLEDAQITAEDSLRKTQDIETQNVATALKHMEAYCLSSNPDPDLAHMVTQDDFKKLDRQRLIQQSLPRKHESAINVLRSRQERAMKLKVQKQEAELVEMDAEFEKEKTAEEWQHAQESERLNAVIAARRKRLQQRWDLKYEMWRRDWESQHGTQFDSVDWPLKTQYGGPICGISESSETTTPIHAAA